MKRTKLVHPFLFALYPILSMVNVNIGQVEAVEPLRITLIVLTSLVILLLILKLITNSWDIAALICSFGLLLFFSYGQVYLEVKEWAFGTLLVGRHRFLGPLWLLLMLTWTYIVLIKHKWRYSLTIGLNIISTVAVLIPLVSIITYVSQEFRIEQSSMDVEVSELELPMETSDIRFPDIYYIIVDGYARDDILLDLYDYDNSEFINFLQDMGFYIATESRSNYNQSDLSLASSLNMTYLDFIPKSYGVNLRNKAPLREMINNVDSTRKCNFEGWNKR